MTGKDELIEILESGRYRLLGAENRALVYYVTRNVSMEGLGTEDVERVYIIPTAFLVLSERGSSIIRMKKWIKELEELALIFKVLSDIDGRIDSGNGVDLSEVSDKRIVQYASIVESKREEDLSVWSNYTRLLQKLYLPYGDYLGNKILHGDEVRAIQNLSLALTNVLVVQQIMDDVADWKDDLESDKETFLTRRIKKGSGGEGELGRMEKEFFLVNLLPIYFLNIEVLEDQQKQLDLSNDKLNIFYRELIKDLLGGIREVRDVVKEFKKNVVSTESL